MSSLLYRLINPPVKALLRSPFHRLLSHNTLLLEFTGRRTGRLLSTPISYREAGGHYHCFTSRSSGWWRNLAGSRPVQIRVAGRRFQAIPEVERNNRETMAIALREFLLAVPRDATHAGVRLDDRGEPSESDIRRVVPEMVYLRLIPTQGQSY